MTSSRGFAENIGRRGAVKVLGAGAASALLGPLFPGHDAPAPVAEYFQFPLQGRVMLGYGHLQPLHDRQGNPTGGHHIGLDLNLGQADEDLDLPAALTASGRCVATIEVPYGCGLGRLALFEHSLPDGSRVYSRYAHLARVLVAPGHSYRRGEIVGTIGNSGCQRSPHLHFDMAPEATWLKWLQARPWYYPDRAPSAWIEQRFLDPRAFIEARLPPLAESSRDPDSGPPTLDFIPSGDARAAGS